MTPDEHYRTILADVERFLQERAQRYFAARYADSADAELLAVQCDTLTVVLKTYLEPQVAWFERYDTDATVPGYMQRLPGEGFLTIDLEPEAPQEAAPVLASEP
jgi:hypothetical protein